MTDSDEGFIRSFKDKVRLVPQQVFASFNGNPVDFETLDRKSDAFAAGLRRLGLAPGDRVAVMMRNSPYSLAVLFGLAKAGIVWVPLNAQLRGEGLRYILEHCEPRGIVCDSDLVPTIRECGVGSSLPRALQRLCSSRS